jgi:hypothetical protein
MVLAKHHDKEQSVSPSQTAEYQRPLDFEAIFAEYRRCLELTDLFDQFAASMARLLSKESLDRYPFVTQMRSLHAHLTANRSGSFLAMQQTILLARYVVVAMHNSPDGDFSTCIMISNALESRFSELESLIKRKTTILAGGGAGKSSDCDGAVNRRGGPTSAAQIRPGTSEQGKDSARVYAFHQL